MNMLFRATELVARFEGKFRSRL